MKKIVFNSIGDYELINSNTDNTSIKIAIKKELKSALTKLEHFSHCILFFKSENKISCIVVKFVELNSKTAKIIADCINKIDEIQGNLVDIKPYFPCEEDIEIEEIKYVKSQGYIPFEGDIIGEYLYINKSEKIKMCNSDTLTKVQITKVLKTIKPGEYLRVLWWFDKFDNTKYRSNLMCNPPYDNAPKCGVFATRSPVRPNPLASTIVKVLEVDLFNQNISIVGFDGFEKSKILQIMPYTYQNLTDIKVPKWVEHWTKFKTFRNISSPMKDSKVEVLTKENDKSVFVEELESDENFETNDNNLNEIIVENAKIHNLKDISVKIPKGKITLITGVSGSGKSSLAFDTIHYESQKRFIDLVSSNSIIGSDLKESMVGKIYGLQPSIAIEQKNFGSNPRSTVSTVTRIGEYLRLLFATIGERICPNCNQSISENNICVNCNEFFFTITPAIFNYNHPEYMCPVCKGLGEELQVDIDLIVSNQELSILDGASVWWGNLRKHREKPNANWMKGEVLALANDMKEDLEVPFKNLSQEFKNQIFYGSKGREVTLKYENTNGRAGTITRPVEGVVNILHRLLADSDENKSIDHIERFIVNKKCSRCNGERLREEGRMVNIGGTRYPQVTLMSITTLKNWCHLTYNQLDNVKKEKSKMIFTKIIARLKKIEKVGLSYINLNRSIPTLSGGEAQRLKIATQFGTGLTNILYVMDEPSKGLHPMDFKFLIETIKELKNQNNTVIVVEHKKEFINMADYLIEIGSGAGQYGGNLLKAEYVNSIEELDFARYNFELKDDKKKFKNVILLKGVKTNNLKNIDVKIPLSKFTCVIGISGSGKSSLITKTLYPAVMKELSKNTDVCGEYDNIQGVEKIKEIYCVSQKAIGKNSRSNPATYTGVFDLIRAFYANLSESKKLKYTKENFSFNSTKGQCDECKGAGEICIPMHYMQDIFINCSKCNGTRYKEDVLKVRFNGYSIADLLQMEIGEVKELFDCDEKISDMLDMMCKVGLSYLKLGQSASTLSGGEAQRIKLAKELCDKKTKDVLYILDEPTSGLHDDDVLKIAFIIKELTSKGATVIVIEHNPILINEADYVIEMGPEGGDKGGYILREGWMQEL